MVSEEIVAKDNSYIKEEDRIAQRLVFVALENNDKDELREAFHYIYKLYHDKLYALALLKVDVRADAEDVVLDSFSDLFHSIMNGKKIKYIKSYLYQIFLNKCIDYNLANNRYKENCHLYSSIDELVDLDDFIQQIELNDLMDRCLDSKEKYILIHYILREESLLDIKKDLNLKHIDIYKVYKKILQKLKKGVGDIYGR